MTSREPVAPGRLERHRAVDLAALGERLQRPHRHRRAVDVEEAPGRRRGCRRSRSRRRPSDAKSPRHPLADLVLDGAHVVATPPRPGPGGRPAAGSRTAPAPRSPGGGRRASSQRRPSRRSSFHEVTDHTSATTPQSSRSSSWASSAHGHADTGGEQLHARRVVGQALGGALGVEVDARAGCPRRRRPPARPAARIGSL